MGTHLLISDRRLFGAMSQRGLVTYDDFVNCTQGEIVSSRGSATTRRVSLHPEGDAAIYLKTYRYPLRWRTALRRDRCSVEAANYAILRGRCGLNVPNVVVVGYRRSLGRLHSALIVTREVDGAVTLEGWLGGGRRRSGELKEMIRGTAKLVSAMHAAGFFHVDLQLRNILVTGGESGAGALYVLDSARGSASRGAIGRAYGRFRDLSSLFKGAREHLSRADLLRWLCMYFGVARPTSLHRELIRTIFVDRRLKDGGGAE